MTERRIGPRMQDAIWASRHYPGVLKPRLGRMIGPHLSAQSGILSINRALKLGLLRLGTCEEADCKTPSDSHRHIWAV